MSDLAALTSDVQGNAIGGQAPPGWQSRLRSSITFRAPNGQQFSAAWQGDEIQLTKRVGRFEAPDVQGTTVQDLGAAGLGYPLTLHFEGESHDVNAMRFVQAMQTQHADPWTVVHPVYGTLALRPISATLSADPTGSANVTRVETQWIEPGPAASLLPVPALGAQITGLATELDSGSLESFVEQAASGDPAAVASLVTTATADVQAIQASPIATMIQRAGDVRSEFDTVYAQVMGAITAPVMDLMTTASGVQRLLALPADVEADITARLAAYQSMIQGLIESFVPAADEEARTATVMTELVLTSAVTGMARCAATATPKTREQSVQAITQVAAALDVVTTALDGAQSVQGGAYFSASRTWSDLARLVAMVQALLLQLLFDLKVAKRFTLDRPRTPIEITITEYGGLGPADANLDLFLYTNRLRDLDILLLPAGREVVVYV